MGQDIDIGLRIDTLFDSALEGLTEPIHRCDYDVIFRIRQSFELLLREEGIDLSFQSLVTPKGIKVGGNRSGISSDYSRAVFMAGWRKIENHEEVDKAFKTAKGFYESKYCVDAKPISRDLAYSYVSSGHRFETHGIGSCQSITETDCDVYVDTDGYVMVSRTCLVWD